jgi:hypothetical protein
MLKHQLLMPLDEARVDSRQCFLKSFSITPFLCETCVDTYGQSGRAAVWRNNPGLGGALAVCATRFFLGGRHREVEKPALPSLFLFV